MTAAGAEEQAGLHALRQQAAATARELNDTAAALADRLDSASPRRWARRKAAAATSKARHAAVTRARHAAARAAALPAPKLALTAALTTSILVIAAAVTWQHRRTP